MSLIVLGAFVSLSLAGADPQVASLQYTNAAVESGAEVYAESCARCHGGELEGTERFPALSGEDFAAKWDGQTVGDLYTFIHDEMPLGRGGTLTDEQYSNVTAFVLANSGFTLEPSGDADVSLAYGTALSF